MLCSCRFVHDAGQFLSLLRIMSIVLSLVSCCDPHGHVGKGSCKRSTGDHLGPFSHVPLDRVKQGVKFNVNAMNLSGLPLGSFEG